MNIQKNLLELEASAQRISDGLAAIRVMIVGLDGEDSAYTGAFHAVWHYLSDADAEFQKHLAACLDAVS